MLHLNELPLRYLVQYLDGVLSGAVSSSGQIGKKLANSFANNNRLLNLKSLKYNFLRKNNTNQQYLLDIAVAVSYGHRPPGVSDQNSGKLSHASRLTTANRILRLYPLKTLPSNNFLILINYASKVHVPMWLKSKKKSKTPS